MIIDSRPAASLRPTQPLGPRLARVLGIALLAAGCAAEAPRAVPAGLAPPPPRRPPPILSAFGTRDGPSGDPRAGQHTGIDIRAAVGTPVLAAADGVVLRVGEGPRSGRLIVIAHAAELATVYYHLSAIEVAAGQVVRRGTVIGRTGASGNATTPHLHFGVCRREGGRCGDRRESGWVDPRTLWIEGTPCLLPGQRYPAKPLRLTFPVPCPG